MQIPEEVLNKTRQILAKRKERDDIQQKVQEKRRQHIESINLLRKSQEAELYECARQVWEWVYRFLITEESALILAVRNPLLLFTARFWEGAPVNSKTEGASLSLKVESLYSSPVGIIIYEEYSRQWTHGHKEYCNQSDLVNNLHPECLKQFAAALQNGTVWQKIDQDLSRCHF